jgi:hypothetical protein
MPYDDDDDLFGEEFDFVDEDDSAEEDSGVESEEPPETKPRRRPAAKGKTPPERAPAERPKGRAKPPVSPGRRAPRPVEDEPASAPPSPPEPALFDDDDETIDAETPRDEPAPVPTGPPADHVVHVYEYGTLKRTIPRKFTDEEAVSFAEEYTRSGKAYGRYAVATPDDEEPSPTFAGASRGN